MRPSALILVATCLCAASPATAQCQPEVLDADASLSITGVSIEPGGLVTGTLQFRYGNTEPSPSASCAAIVRVSRIASGLAANFPRYTLLAPGNSNVEILPDGATGGSPRADVVLDHLPSGESGRTVSFQFRVLTEWGLSAGTFTEQLLFSLYDNAGGLRNQSIVTLTVAIPAAVSVRFAGAVVSASDTGRIELG